MTRAHLIAATLLLPLLAAGATATHNTSPGCTDYASGWHYCEYRVHCEPDQRLHVTAEDYTDVEFTCGGVTAACNSPGASQCEAFSGTTTSSGDGLCRVWYHPESIHGWRFHCEPHNVGHPTLGTCDPIVNPPPSFRPLTPTDALGLDSMDYCLAV